METSTRQIGALLRTIEEKDADFDRVGRLLSSGYFADGLDRDADLSDRDSIRAAIGLPPIGQVETIVDFTKTFAEMVGNLPYGIPFGGDLFSLYPIEGKGMRRFRNILFKYDYTTPRRTHVRFMKKNGWSPARHEHGLAFWRALAPKQRWIRVACLGYLAKQGGPDEEREVLCIQGRRDSNRVFYSLKSRQIYGGLPGIDYMLGIKEITEATRP